MLGTQSITIRLNLANAALFLLSVLAVAVGGFAIGAAVQTAVGNGGEGQVTLSELNRAAMPPAIIRDPSSEELVHFLEMDRAILVNRQEPAVITEASPEELGYFLEMDRAFLDDRPEPSVITDPSPEELQYFLEMDRAFGGADIR